jgi:hypothetical protein
MRAVLLLLLGWLCLLPVLAAAQARIENTATLRYAGADGGARAVRSNTVALMVQRVRLASRIELRGLPAGLDASGARCTGSPGALVGTPLTPEQASAAPKQPVIEPATGVVILVTTPGSNQDRPTRETLTIFVSSSSGTGTVTPVTLTETAPDSGIFAAAFPPIGGRADLAACLPPLKRGDTLSMTFAGDEGSLSSNLTALVDPAGIVFDSTSGAPINGAQVTLLDEAGQPASVFGDDGTSSYPATMTSGEGMRDAGGRFYPVAPGGYRFPLVAPGRYHLRVVPPAGYLAPSRAVADALAALRDPSGQPFLLDAASTGGVLTVAGTAPVIADIPLDPTDAAALLLTITASRARRVARRQCSIPAPPPQSRQRRERAAAPYRPAANGPALPRRHLSRRHGDAGAGRLARRRARLARCGSVA